MKKFVLFFGVLLCSLSFARAQVTVPVMQSQTFLATGGPVTMPIMNQTGTGITSHTLIWTATGTVSTCTVALQGASTYGGSYTALTGGATQTCTSSGVYNLGSIASNFVEVNILTFSGTGSVTFTYVGNIPGASAGVGNSVGLVSCGSSSSCASPTTLGQPLKVVYGTYTVSSATTFAITGMPAFSSATSYSCSTTNSNGHAYTTGAEAISATAVTFVSGTSNSDTWSYVCIGY
jgi:hypothetical protein